MFQKKGLLLLNWDNAEYFRLRGAPHARFVPVSDADVIFKVLQV